MAKIARKLLTFGLFVFGTTVIAQDRILLKSELPILDRPDISVHTFYHSKFKGYYTIVTQKTGDKRVVLYKTINPGQPYIHHERAVYWAMCEFEPSTSSSSDSEDLFDSTCRYDLFPISEAGEEDDS